MIYIYIYIYIYIIQIAGATERKGLQVTLSQPENSKSKSQPPLLHQCKRFEGEFHRS